MNSKIFTLFISTVLFSAGALAQGVRANISSETINIFMEEFGANNAAAPEEWKRLVRMRTGTGVDRPRNTTITASFVVDFDE